MKKYLVAYSICKWDGFEVRSETIEWDKKSQENIDNFEEEKQDDEHAPCYVLCITELDE